MRIVASNPDAIGDFVLRQPFYSALHQAGHEILLIVRPHAMPLISYVAPFAKTLVLPADPYHTDVAANAGMFQPLMDSVAAFAPDLIVLASYYWTNFEEHLAAGFPHIPVAGMSGRHVGIAPPRGLLQADGRALQPMVEVPENMPELEKNQNLARAITGRDIILPDPAITVSEAVKVQTLSHLEYRGLRPGGYWVVCVGGTMNVSIKTWSAEHWADVLRPWMGKHETRILFTGLRSEEPAIRATRSLLGEHASRAFEWIDDSGTDIDTLLGLLQMSNGYIGHDTAPMHLAAALEKPVLALFGGGTWGRFLPAANSARVLTVGVPCVGCGWNCPFTTAYCIKTIPAGEVLDALNNLTDSTEARRDIRVLKESAEAADAMLNESAKLSAVRKQEMYFQTSTLAQRNAEIAVLKQLVRDTGAAAETNRIAAVERLEIMELLSVKLDQAKGDIASREQIVAQRDAEMAILKQMLRDTAATAESNRLAAVKRLEIMELLNVKLDQAKGDIASREQIVAQRDAEIAILKQILRETAATAESNRMAAEERLRMMESLDDKLKKVSSEVSTRDQLITERAAEAAERTAEAAALTLSLRNTAAEAESNRLAAVERLRVIETLDVELKRVSSEVGIRDHIIADYGAEVAALTQLLRKTAAEAEFNRLAATERLSAIAALNTQLQESRSRAVELLQSLTKRNDELAGHCREVENLKQQAAAGAKCLEDQQKAYSNLMTDRSGWVEIYKKAEAKLKKIDDLFWHERLWDTAQRIHKHALYGRQYFRKPEERPLPSMTIVTPVFNCAEYIRDTIESVLNQNYPRLDYVIVDGGSTDGTLAILEEYKGRIAQVISEPDNGMYDAIGKGFTASCNDVLAYLNADDMYEPGALLRVGAYFRDNPAAQVIYHENTVAANGWRFANIAQPRVDVFDLLKGHILFQDGVFFRSGSYIAVGGVNRKLRRAGDYALWLEMALWFKLHRVPGHVSAFRVRSGQISGNMDAYELEQQLARKDFHQRFSAKRKFKRLPAHWLNTLRNFSARLFDKREFFYAADFANMPPPPGQEPSLRIAPPVCPLSGKTPDCLLLSSRHPMLHELDVGRTYFKTDSRVAINHPAPNPAQWAVLRANRYAVPSVDWSNPPAGTFAPSAPYASPYANAKMRGSLLEKCMRTVFEKCIPPKMAYHTPTVALSQHSLRSLTPIFSPADSRIRLLDVDCLDGEFLDSVAAATQWQRAGLESDPAMAAAASAKGHRVVLSSINDAPFAFHLHERFHIIHLGNALPYLPHPVKTLNALKNLLAPGGVITIASPNLDSKQQEWFGPAWAHWHLTRFHALYSRRAFEQVAKLTNMEILRSASFSHSEYTAFSLYFLGRGLAWSVPHRNDIAVPLLKQSERLERLVRTAWDFRGKGDFITALLRPL